AFVSKLNASGSVLVYSTYLGGLGTDGGAGIAVDSVGDAYVTGFTTGGFPTYAGLIFPLGAFPSFGGFTDAFVAKLNETGSGLLYSTYLGGSGEDGGNGIAVDSAGNAYVTGDTSSADFPIAFPIRAALNGFSDAFVAKLNASGFQLVYSTYLGGSGEDGGGGIAVDSDGNAYVAGDALSTDFPTTAGAFQRTSGIGGGAFVAKIDVTTHLIVSPVSLGAITTAGTPFVFNLSASDPKNIEAPTYSGTTHSTSPDKLAPLPADYTFPALDNGVHTFSVPLRTAGTQTITANQTIDATVAGTASVTVN